MSQDKKKVPISHIPITQRDCTICGKKMLVSEGDAAIVNGKAQHTNH
jgi:hypothetical protein